MTRRERDNLTAPDPFQVLEAGGVGPFGDGPVKQLCYRFLAAVVAKLPRGGSVRRLEDVKCLAW
jgi:hypothetical protein